MTGASQAAERDIWAGCYESAVPRSWRHRNRYLGYWTCHRVLEMNDDDDRHGDEELSRNRFLALQEAKCLTGITVMYDKENMPLSIMARKFLAYNEEQHSHPPNPDIFRKELYFFYGTLTDPATLAKVLDLPNQPVLRSAKIIGYRCMLWGPYPALIDDRFRGTVRGVVYEVQSPEERKLLESYETDRYENRACRIVLEDDTKVVGRTFRWKGKIEDLEWTELDVIFERDILLGPDDNEALELARKHAKAARRYLQSSSRYPLEGVRERRTFEDGSFLAENNVAQDGDETVALNEDSE
ncbi:MAG: hypothetical protein M1839_001778 [Geoglossum umbratile]|nr:MAG: hypothetical protein M1839_001778 [Geoglossum umbratile]